MSTILLNVQSLNDPKMHLANWRVYYCLVWLCTS